MRRFFILLLIPFFLIACEDDQPAFPVIPEITLLSVGPTTMTEFEDSLYIQIQYRDGDGDIGFENADSFTLFVQDARLTAPDKYFVRPLSPIGSNVAIEGTLDILIRNSFLLGTSNQETTYFTLQLKDRAGNWSNIIQTPDITINAQ